MARGGEGVDEEAGAPVYIFHAWRWTKTLYHQQYIGLDHLINVFAAPSALSLVAAPHMVPGAIPKCAMCSAALWFRRQGRAGKVSRK